MSDIRGQYNALIFQKSTGLAEVKSVLAQIAPGLESEEAHVATLPNGKYQNSPDKDQYRIG